MLHSLTAYRWCCRTLSYAHSEGEKRPLMSLFCVPVVQSYSQQVCVRNQHRCFCLLISLRIFKTMVSVVECLVASVDTFWGCWCCHVEFQVWVSAVLSPTSVISIKWSSCPPVSALLYKISTPPLHDNGSSNRTTAHSCLILDLDRSIFFYSIMLYLDSDVERCGLQADLHSIRLYQRWRQLLLREMLS